MKALKKKDYTLNSVKNAARILRLFSLERPELGVTEISRLLGLNKSTAYHLMTFLTAEGLLEKSPKSRYRLGLAFLRYSGIITTQMEIHRESLPFLERLAEELGESAFIGILEGTNVAYLQKVDVKHPHPLSPVGNRNPVSCTGSGKAILAFQKEEIISGIAERLQPYGPNSITDPERFKKHLKDIRSQGYALCIDEIYEGVSSIGVPVRDYTGEVVAAVSIAGPTERIRSCNIEHAVTTLKQAGLGISAKLGYYG
ncbi:IclR family transcriptional regulator [Paenibacillus naphthalenovorans]|uniref:IclR family transcriptional regulator n=1 Tax=Paenibacillus naphthalenovorans TaxID=162209 RepID=A0A0U2M9Y1_9BACL|nr:IclR family transcriptional regulator [Paenibacillus naphthalenovorans]ALS25408.1 IclR family transcriptional regulator [Paenibacillus naphthalenovorans]